MKKIQKICINKWIGFVLLVLYVVSAAGFVFYCTKLGMLPAKYIAIIDAVLAALAVLFAVMHKRLVSSVISMVFTVILTAACVFGSHYLIQTNRALAEVTKVSGSTDVISVYVMEEDNAENLEDIRDYSVGIVKETDRDNTDRMLESLDADLRNTLEITEYDSMFDMADALKEGAVGAFVLNDAYVGIMADVKSYNWVSTDIRRIATVEQDVEEKKESSVPEDVPETFVVYVSGIDTYGDISARSRSDVNILAVVNTEKKIIRLISTPRDFYVDYSVTNGAKDKLTHAGIYGVEASMDALQRLYGITIDYYLKVNFSGFVQIIDALGGVEVYSTYDFASRDYQFTKGYNQVNGEAALAFARDRYSFEEGDIQRGKNQMEVVRAVIQKCMSSALLTNYASVMNAVSGSFETNMPNDQIASLVKMQLSDMAQWSITSFTAEGTGMYAETFSMPGQELYVMVPDEESIERAKGVIEYNGVKQ